MKKVPMSQPLPFTYAGVAEAMVATQSSKMREASPDPESLVPTIVLYEVSKVLKRDVGEPIAMECALRMQQSKVVGLTDVLALEAADIALEHGLTMADAIIYATAQRFDAELYSSDADLKGLPGVHFIPLP